MEVRLFLGAHKRIMATTETLNLDKNLKEGRVGIERVWNCFLRTNDFLVKEV